MTPVFRNFLILLAIDIASFILVGLILGEVLAYFLFLFFVPAYPIIYLWWSNVKEETAEEHRRFTPFVLFMIFGFVGYFIAELLLKQKQNKVEQSGFDGVAENA